MFIAIKKWLLRRKIKRLGGQSVYNGHPLSKWLLDLLTIEDEIERLMKPDSGSGYRDFTPELLRLRALVDERQKLVCSLRPISREILSLLEKGMVGVDDRARQSLEKICAELKK